VAGHLQGCGPANRLLVPERSRKGCALSARSARADVARRMLPMTPMGCRRGRGIWVCAGLALLTLDLGCKKSSGPGSCPYLFLWDHGAYVYAGDLSGSPLAAGLTFFKPEYYGLNVYSLGAWSTDGPTFRMRVRELGAEASYFDQASLAMVDVPAGYDVYNEWSSTPQLGLAPSRRYVTVHAPRPPLGATTDGGADVLRQLADADGVPAAVEHGVTRVVLDFGAVAHPERARLVVTTWGAYGDYRDQAAPPYSEGTVIETPDDAGHWQQRVVAGKSAADAKTWAIDVAGALRPGAGQLRITMAHDPSTIDLLDQVLLDDSEPVPFTIARVAPSVATLALGGASTVHAPTVAHRAIVDEDRDPPSGDELLAGDYTRLGDVAPLLLAADDRFVIMANGDQLDLEFPAPPQAPATTRRVFLEADVFYSLKYHPFGQLTDTIEPLPFHGMQAYPYPPEEWPYRDDPDYARYLREWNTRAIAP
jgi:hypothetical protein